MYGRPRLAFALYAAPFCAALATAASWLHFHWTGGLHLTEFPRSIELTRAGYLASLGLALLGACCVVVYRALEHRDLQRVLLAGLLTHVVMLFALPLLSNDLYTYLTYGELTAHGMNPHVYGPGALAGSELAKLTPWTNTPSVYGPVSDLMNAATGYLGLWTHSPVWPALALYKVMVGALDLASIYVAYRLAKGSTDLGLTKGFALLALNPLLAWEAAGQGHNDGVIVACGIFFVAAARYGRQASSIVALTLGILAKFVLVPTLALYLRIVARESVKRAVLLALLGLLVTCVLYAPFWSGPETFTIVKGPKPINEGTSLYTVFWKVMRVLHAAPSLYRTTYLAWVWGGRLLVVGLGAFVFWRAKTVRDVERGSLVLFLATVGTSAIMMPWYSSWMLPFAAVEEDERWRSLALGITVVTAPAMGIPMGWLLLPLAQLAGLVALALWFKPRRQLRKVSPGTA